MKVLLDECVDPGLALAFGDHQVDHVRNAGMAGLQNGILLRQASELYDVLVTVDKNMPYQQSLRGLTISVVVIDYGSTAIESLLSAAPRVLEALVSISPGSFQVVRRSTEDPS